MLMQLCQTVASAHVYANTLKPLWAVGVVYGHRLSTEYWLSCHSSTHVVLDPVHAFVWPGYMV